MSTLLLLTFLDPDQKIAMKDLPAAVRAALQRESVGATVKRLSKEVEGGKTLYEVETIRDGRSRDLLSMRAVR